MDTINSIVARQYTQEHIARAQAERLAKEARQAGSARSRRRPFRRSRRPVVAGAVERSDDRRPASSQEAGAGASTTKPSKPAWQELLDPEERPNREDLGAQHNVFLDSMLEPVPLPRWLRGKRRPPRDKLS